MRRITAVAYVLVLGTLMVRPPTASAVDATGSWAVCVPPSSLNCGAPQLTTTLVVAADGSFTMEVFPFPPPFGPGCVYSGTIDSGSGAMMGVSCRPQDPTDLLFGTATDTSIGGSFEMGSCIHYFQAVRACGACDDGQACTTDGCGVTACSEMASSCSYATAPTASSCDADACTMDGCSFRTCETDPVVCDDGNPCTTDSCDAGLGCVFAPAPGPCDDGDACTAGDTCSGGECVGGPAVTCGPCETCAASAGCTVGPKAGCRTSVNPHRTRISLRSHEGRDKLKWAWAAGQATSAADFGDPLAADDYTLCVFDQGAPAPRLLLSTTAFAGSDCAAGSCWRGTGNPAGSGGFMYRSSGALLPDGLSRVKLTPGAAGRAKVSVAGQGPNLGMPSLLVVTAPVTAQLQSETGQCWETTFSAAQTHEDIYRARGSD